MSRHYSLADHLLMQADEALRTLVPGAHRARRANPAAAQPEAELDETQRRHVAAMLRVNHCGEVCAQALYQGQALSARQPVVREAMAGAAEEEVDHLVWCEERLQELGGRTSLLNPLFYGASFGLGAIAGALGDRISLGFVAATEEQVGEHLREHLARLPATDTRSRAILDTMLADEEAHATRALAAGGQRFPYPVRRLMAGMAKVMTRSTYYV